MKIIILIVLCTIFTSTIQTEPDPINGHSSLPFGWKLARVNKRPVTNPKIEPAHSAGSVLEENVAESELIDQSSTNEDKSLPVGWKLAKINRRPATNQYIEPVQSADSVFETKIPVNELTSQSFTAEDNTSLPGSKFARINRRLEINSKVQPVESVSVEKVSVKELNHQSFTSDGNPRLPFGRKLARVNKRPVTNESDDGFEKNLLSNETFTNEDQTGASPEHLLHESSASEGFKDLGIEEVTVKVPVVAERNHNFENVVPNTKKLDDQKIFENIYDQDAPFKSTILQGKVNLLHTSTEILTTTDKSAIIIEDKHNIQQETQNNNFLPSVEKIGNQLEQRLKQKEHEVKHEEEEPRKDQMINVGSVFNQPELPPIKVEKEIPKHENLEVTLEYDGELPASDAESKQAVKEIHQVKVPLVTDISDFSDHFFESKKILNNTNKSVNNNLSPKGFELFHTVNVPNIKSTGLNRELSGHEKVSSNPEKIPSVPNMKKHDGQQIFGNIDNHQDAPFKSTILQSNENSQLHTSIKDLTTTKSTIAHDNDLQQKILANSLVARNEKAELLSKNVDRNGISFKFSSLQDAGNSQLHASTAVLENIGPGAEEKLDKHLQSSKISSDYFQKEVTPSGNKGQRFEEASKTKPELAPTKPENVITKQKDSVDDNKPFLPSNEKSGLFAKAEDQKGIPLKIPILRGIANTPSSSNKDFSQLQPLHKDVTATIKTTTVFEEGSKTATKIDSVPHQLGLTPTRIEKVFPKQKEVADDNKPFLAGNERTRLFVSAENQKGIPLKIPILQGIANTPSTSNKDLTSKSPIAVEHKHDLQQGINKLPILQGAGNSQLQLLHKDVTATIKTTTVVEEGSKTATKTDSVPHQPGLTSTRIEKVFPKEEEVVDVNKPFLAANDRTRLFVSAENQKGIPLKIPILQGIVNTPSSSNKDFTSKSSIALEHKHDVQQGILDISFLPRNKKPGIFSNTEYRYGIPFKLPILQGAVNSQLQSLHKDVTAGIKTTTVFEEGSKTTTKTDSVPHQPGLTPTRIEKVFPKQEEVADDNKPFLAANERTRLFVSAENQKGIPLKIPILQGIANTSSLSNKDFTSTSSIALEYKHDLQQEINKVPILQGAVNSQLQLLHKDVTATIKTTTVFEEGTKTATKTDSVPHQPGLTPTRIEKVFPKQEEVVDVNKPFLAANERTRLFVSAENQKRIPLKVPILQGIANTPSSSNKDSTSKSSIALEHNHNLQQGIVDFSFLPRNEKPGIFSNTEHRNGIPFKLPILQGAGYSQLQSLNKDVSTTIASTTVFDEGSNIATKADSIPHQPWLTPTRNENVFSKQEDVGDVNKPFLSRSEKSGLFVSAENQKWIPFKIPILQGSGNTHLHSSNRDFKSTTKSFSIIEHKPDLQQGILVKSFLPKIEKAGISSTSGDRGIPFKLPILQGAGKSQLQSSHKDVTTTTKTTVIEDSRHEAVDQEALDKYFLPSIKITTDHFSEDVTTSDKNSGHVEEESKTATKTDSVAHQPGLTPTRVEKVFLKQEDIVDVNKAFVPRNEKTTLFVSTENRNGIPFKIPNLQGISNLQLHSSNKDFTSTGNYFVPLEHKHDLQGISDNSFLPRNEKTVIFSNNGDRNGIPFKFPILQGAGNLQLQSSSKDDATRNTDSVPLQPGLTPTRIEKIFPKQEEVVNKPFLPVNERTGLFVSAENQKGIQFKIPILQGTGNTHLQSSNKLFTSTANSPRPTPIKTEKVFTKQEQDALNKFFLPTQQKTSVFSKIDDNIPFKITILGGSGSGHLTSNKNLTQSIKPAVIHGHASQHVLDQGALDTYFLPSNENSAHFKKQLIIQTTGDSSHHTNFKPKVGPMFRRFNYSFIIPHMEHKSGFAEQPSNHKTLDNHFLPNPSNSHRFIEDNTRSDDFLKLKNFVDFGKQTTSTGFDQAILDDYFLPNPINTNHFREQSSLLVDVSKLKNYGDFGKYAPPMTSTPTYVSYLPRRVQRCRFRIVQRNNNYSPHYYRRYYVPRFPSHSEGRSRLWYTSPSRMMDMFRRRTFGHY